ncbi:MAG: hypothetical protein CO093_01330, partial [Alphaproteobacteria bacterium CG_4_9_14_3_um_filter_47_13]
MADINDMVHELGDYVETNYKHMTNPNQSVLGSTVRCIFNAISWGTPLLNKVSEYYGIPVKGWHDTLDKIIESTESLGSDAAEKIKTYTEKTKALDHVFKNHN